MRRISVLALALGLAPAVAYAQATPPTQPPPPGQPPGQTPPPTQTAPAADIPVGTGIIDFSVRGTSVDGDAARATKATLDGRHHRVEGQGQHRGDDDPRDGARDGAHESGERHHRRERHEQDEHRPPVEIDDPDPPRPLGCAVAVDTVRLGHGRYCTGLMATDPVTGAEGERGTLTLRFTTRSLVGSVATPTLVVVGDQDFRTPLSDSEQYYQALQLKGVPTALVKVPGASHGGLTARPSQSAAKASAILAWFEKYKKK